ncbi:MAG: RHS repeat-associated core domain-containing protein [Saprospiraceae bacterium]|nr:RHS repeat-associated core domain-containing protein [Saprospiraceae bacterium]
MNFRANGTAVTFLEEMHYYPFGMQMEGMGTQNPANKYLYNGKELNDDLGLNLSDYGARWYDAALGRWWSVDPLAAEYPSWSPYNFTFNNPIKYVDPNGMDAILVIKPGVNGANGTISVILTFNYEKSKGNSFVESATRSFKNTWGNGEIMNSGDVYQGKAFTDIEIDGQKYDVTYQLVLNGTDNVLSATGEGENILNIISDGKTNGSNYREGILEYRASQEKLNQNTNFGHELSHVMGIGHNDELTNEKGQTSISAGNTTDRSVIQQDVINSVEGAVQLAGSNSRHYLLLVTWSKFGLFALLFGYFFVRS